MSLTTTLCNFSKYFNQLPRYRRLMHHLIHFTRICIFGAFISGAVAFASYEEGLRAYLEKDFETAIGYWSNTDVSNDPRALFAMGVMHMRGIGTEQDQETGAQYYRKAADFQFASAQFNLGLAYYSGRGVAKDLEQSRHWWQLAAEQGHAIAQYNLGAILWSGSDAIKDQALAMHWFRKAKENGNRDASNFLLTLFAPMYKELNANSLELARKDGTRQIPLVDEVGMYKLGLQAMQDKQYGQAFGYWQPLALDGHVDSQYQLGILYENGLGVEKDFTAALDWYQRAAQKGQGEAQFRLGIYHMNENPDRNEALGFYWIQSAADNDSVDAINYINNNL